MSVFPVEGIFEPLPLSRHIEHTALGVEECWVQHSGLGAAGPGVQPHPQTLWHRTDISAANP